MMDAQITNMFAMRNLLKQAVRGYEGAHPNEAIAFLPSAHVNTVAGTVTANETFVYEPADVSSGAAQITLKFTDKETIKRIAEVNAARRLGVAPSKTTWATSVDGGTTTG